VLERWFIAFGIECNTGLAHFQAQEALFKDSQKALLEEVFNNLQNMNLVDLLHCNTSSRSAPERELSYELPKIYSWIYSDREDPMLDYYMRRLNKVSNDEYEFSENDGSDRTFLKLKLFLSSFNDID